MVDKTQKLKLKIRSWKNWLHGLKRKSYQSGHQSTEICGGSKLPYNDWRKRARNGNHKNNYKNNQLEKCLGGSVDLVCDP